MTKSSKTTSGPSVLNYRDPYSGSILNPDPGHTFVSLSMAGASSSSTLVFGLYPSNGANPLSPETDRAIVDDGRHEYNIALSFELSCEDFNQTLNQALSIESLNYNLNTTNCTDFALNLGNTLGCCIPDSEGSWGVGSGSNPGELGEDLRTYNAASSEVIDTPGFAPPSDCN